MLLVLLGSAVALAQVSRENELKAVVLWRFTEFVQWPATAFADSTSPLVIGVLGDHSFGPALDMAVRGQQAQGRHVVVRYYQRVEEIETCHILFVSASAEPELARVLAQLKGRSVLTVGETRQFASQGGMIRLGVEKNRMRLQINWDMAKQAHLNLSSKLLKTAELLRAEQ